MRKRLAFLVLASAAIAGGCTAAGSSPATTPEIPETTTTTTTRATAITTTTTTRATTTTIDRIAEIQAIFEDLERRRLQAIFDQDEEAFRAVYANDQYLERSLVLFRDLEVVSRPVAVVQEVLEVVSSSESCIAAEIRFDTTDLLISGGQGASIHVIERRSNGRWGLSWVGSGWTCDGPHPFS